MPEKNDDSKPLGILLITTFYMLFSILFFISSSVSYIGSFGSLIFVLIGSYFVITGWGVLTLQHWAYTNTLFQAIIFIILFFIFSIFSFNGFLFFVYILPFVSILWYITTNKHLFNHDLKHRIDFKNRILQCGFCNRYIPIDSNICSYCGKKVDINMIDMKKLKTNEGKTLVKIAVIITICILIFGGFMFYIYLNSYRYVPPPPTPELYFEKDDVENTLTVTYVGSSYYWNDYEIRISNNDYNDVMLTRSNVYLKGNTSHYGGCPEEWGHINEGDTIIVKNDNSTAFTILIIHVDTNTLIGEWNFDYY